MRITRYFQCIILLASFNCSLAVAQIKAQNGNTIDTSVLDTFLIRQIDSLHIPGLSIALINDGKIIFIASLDTKTLKPKRKSIPRLYLKRLQ